MYTHMYTHMYIYIYICICICIYNSNKHVIIIIIQITNIIQVLMVIVIIILSLPIIIIILIIQTHWYTTTGPRTRPGRKLDSYSTSLWNIYCSNYSSHSCYIGMLIPVGAREQRAHSCVCVCVCVVVYTSRCVRVLFAQGPCQYSLHRSNVNGWSPKGIHSCLGCCSVDVCCVLFARRTSLPV